MNPALCGPVGSELETGTILIGFKSNQFIATVQELLTCTGFWFQFNCFNT